MSRIEELIRIAEATEQPWEAKIAMGNLPSIMLDNAYLRALSSITGAVLLSMYELNRSTCKALDLTSND